jgi:hypothetical protein
MHSSEGEMATAIIYLRVSTSKQVEAGNGLDAQKAACLAFAEREGLQVAGVFVDAGVSGGAELQSRPGMMDAINALQKGGILLVAKRDRIARDVLNNAVIEKMVSKKKSSIASADGAGNGDDAAAALFPYGFQRSGNELISNDDEVQVVLDVTSWRQVKATWAQCVERLNAEQRYTRSGRPWSVQNLSQVIRRAAA